MNEPLGRDISMDIGNNTPRIVPEPGRLDGIRVGIRVNHPKPHFLERIKT